MRDTEIIHELRELLAERLARLVKELVGVDFLRQSWLGQGLGEVGGAFGCGGGIIEAIYFGVRGGKRVQGYGIVGLSQFDGARGETQSFGAIAVPGIGICCKDPGEVVQGWNKVWVQVNSLAVMRDGLSGPAELA